jgi:WD40 repeat protein
VLVAVVLAAVLLDVVPANPPPLLMDIRHAASALRYSPDGDRIVIRSGFGVAILDATSGVELAAQQTPTCCGMIDGSPGFDVSRDGRFVASTTNDTLLIVRLSSGTRVRSLHLDDIGGPLAFSPDGKRLAVVSMHGDFCLLHEPFDQLQRIRGSTVEANAAAFSPDGKFFVIGGFSRDSTIGVWETGPWLFARALKGEHGYVSAIEFSRDGRWMASQGDGRTLVLWDTRSWLPVWRRSLSGRVLALSPDGRWVAAGGGEGIISILDSRTGAVVRTWTAHSAEGVGAAVFSPSGERIVTSDFKTIRVWDVSSLRPTGTR